MTMQLDRPCTDVSATSFIAYVTTLLTDSYSVDSAGIRPQLSKCTNKLVDAFAPKYTSTYVFRIGYWGDATAKDDITASSFSGAEACNDTNLDGAYDAACTITASTTPPPAKLRPAITSDWSVGLPIDLTAGTPSLKQCPSGSTLSALAATYASQLRTALSDLPDVLSVDAPAFVGCRNLGVEGQVELMYNVRDTHVFGASPFDLVSRRGRLLLDACVGEAAMVRCVSWALGCGGCDACGRLS